MRSGLSEKSSIAKQESKRYYTQDILGLGGPAGAPINAQQVTWGGKRKRARTTAFSRSKERDDRVLRIQLEKEDRGATKRQNWVPGKGGQS